MMDEEEARGRPGDIVLNIEMAIGTYIRDYKMIRTAYNHHDESLGNYSINDWVEIEAICQTCTHQGEEGVCDWCKKEDLKCDIKLSKWRPKRELNPNWPQ